MANQWDSTNEQQSSVQIVLDTVVSGAYYTPKDVSRHAYPMREDPRYAAPHSKSPSMSFEDQCQARVSTGCPVSYGKMPSSNPFPDELRKKRQDNRPSENYGW